MEGHWSVSFTDRDGKKLEPRITLKGYQHLILVCGAGLEQKHRGARKDFHDLPCPPPGRRADIKDHRTFGQSWLQQPKNAYIFLELLHATTLAVRYSK